MSKSEAPISINEHLSALLDDEAGSFEERRVLDELKTDKVLSQKLANYALIGEAMKSGDSQQSSLLVGSSFLDNLHEQIAHEDEFENVILNQAPANQNSAVSAETRSSSILRPIGGFALAASVGALAFMGLQNIGLLDGPAGQAPNVVDRSGPTEIAEITPEVSKSETAAPVITNIDQYAEADAETRSMLKRYVDSHMQYATSSTFVPSVRVIAYTDNQ